MRRVKLPQTFIAVGFSRWRGAEGSRTAIHRRSCGAYASRSHSGQAPLRLRLVLPAVERTFAGHHNRDQPAKHHRADVQHLPREDRPAGFAAGFDDRRLA